MNEETNTGNETKQKCLNPACERAQFTRGLCHGCYKAARKLVSRKETTWGKLYATGKVLKPQLGRPFLTGKIQKWLLS